MGDLGWTPDEFWRCSVKDFVAAWNAKHGEPTVDLSGLDESVDRLREKAKNYGNGIGDPSSKA